MIICRGAHLYIYIYIYLLARPDNILARHDLIIGASRYIIIGARLIIFVGARLYLYWRASIFMGAPRQCYWRARQYLVARASIIISRTSIIGRAYINIILSNYFDKIGARVYYIVTRQYIDVRAPTNI